MATIKRRSATAKMLLPKKRDTGTQTDTKSGAAVAVAAAAAAVTTKGKRSGSPKKRAPKRPHHPPGWATHDEPPVGMHPKK